VESGRFIGEVTMSQFYFALPDPFSFGFALYQIRDLRAVSRRNDFFAR
jgi:hypothetical protein